MRNPWEIKLEDEKSWKNIAENLLKKQQNQSEYHTPTHQFHFDLLSGELTYFLSVPIDLSPVTTVKVTVTNANTYKEATWSVRKRSLIYLKKDTRSLKKNIWSLKMDPWQLKN